REEFLPGIHGSSSTRAGFSQRPPSVTASQRKRPVNAGEPPGVKRSTAAGGVAMRSPPPPSYSPKGSGRYQSGRLLAVTVDRAGAGLGVDSDFNSAAWMTMPTAAKAVRAAPYASNVGTSPHKGAS